NPHATLSSEMRTPLPTGTVTFLFTDIEGSTRLLQKHGDAYGRIRAEHQDIIRRIAASAGGVEVNTAGDSFLLVFREASDAVRSAVDTQLELAGHDWSPAPALRVRMGIHTGEGVSGGDDYVGIDVHRAARIEDAAHGGQIILSDATRALVADRL